MQALRQQHSVEMKNAMDEGQKNGRVNNYKKELADHPPGLSTWKRGKDWNRKESGWWNDPWSVTDKTRRNQPQLENECNDCPEATENVSCKAEGLNGMSTETPVWWNNVMGLPDRTVVDGGLAVPDEKKIEERRIESSSRLSTMPVVLGEVCIDTDDSVLGRTQVREQTDQSEDEQKPAMQQKTAPVIFPKQEYSRILKDFNPGAGRIPRDFLRFDPTELETPLRKLLHAEDNWTYVEPTDGKEWRNESEESEEGKKICNLIAESGMSGNPAAFVRNRMMELSGTLHQRYEMALEEMKLKGPSYMQLMEPNLRSPVTVGEIQPERRG